MYEEQTFVAPGMTSLPYNGVSRRTHNITQHHHYLPYRVDSHAAGGFSGKYYRVRKAFFTPTYYAVDNPMQSGTGAKCHETVRVPPLGLNLAQYREE